MSEEHDNDADPRGPSPNERSEPPPSLDIGRLSRPPRLIVAVGASAGGLESLERLFAQVPSDTGFAFVVIQHLSPHHKTMMVELLARRTGLDVRAASHGVMVRRDTVHLMPPGKRMTIADGRLVLEDQGGDHPHLPIDRFFASLAADAGHRTVAVVLSGTGADGSRGIADVKSLGGLVLAETEVTAAFSGMPDNAVASGYVDYSLAPEEMIEILQAHVRQLAATAEEDANAPARGTGRVLELLHERYAIDFTQYKSATIGRRIERRAELFDAAGDLDGYIANLAEDADELDALYHDLLIGVTRFFRDEACFEKLELDVLPRLFARLPPDRGFRAWVAGCATGEEAYTVAMLVREQIETSGHPLEAKIFATDLHQGALARASLGVYTAEQLEHVSERRRQRHFEPCEGGYRLVDAVRQYVVFARHDVLGDAPFTRLDLVTCRNLLIYFELPAQQKALRLFHFSLRIDGVLMLGPSESLGRLAEEFAVVDETRRLYRKTRDRRLPDDVRFDPPVLMPAQSLVRDGRGGGASLAPAAPATRGSADTRLLEVYDALLDRSMPPSVLIDQEENVVDSYAGAAHYLHYRSRRPDRNVFAALDTPANTELRQAARRARLSGEVSVVAGATLRTSDGRNVECDVRVEPVTTGAGLIEHVLLSFGEREPPARDAVPVHVVNAAVATDPDAGTGSPGVDPRALREEIETLRHRLQQTAELAETSREELQATNEELVASNEELQSSNEELNSVNEELHTVNSEYQGKIAELRELNEDMQHLLASTDIGTVFLDRELRVRRFTSGIQRAYDLTQGDVGRSIESFSHRLVIDGLIERFGEVMQSGRTFEREVRDRDGGALLLRILPYELAGQVAGVVLTLVDIELLDDARVALAESEASLQRRVAELQTLYATAPAGLCFVDRRYRYVRANERMAQIDGVSPDSYSGKPLGDVLPPTLAARVQALMQGIFESGEPCLGLSMRVRTKAHPDEARRYLASYYPVREPSGDIAGCSCVIIEDPHGKPDDEDDESREDEVG